MEDKFVLKSAEDLFHGIIETKSFERYNLSNIYCDYEELKKSFKKNINREPFVYDFIELALESGNKSIRKSVKSILFEKSYNWFITVGQYFFYNLYNWTQNFEIFNKSNFNRFDFLGKWWKKFIQYENQKEKPILNLPEKILLELTNNCNLRCIMCGIGENGYDPSRNLPLNLLKKLCNEVLSEVSLIRLNGLGESTIITNFLEYLNLICELPAQLEIITNLTVQNRAIWNKLLDHQTNFLISCDSSNPIKFESIRIGSKFEVFKKNLNYIGKNISDPLQAHIIFTLMEQNIEDLLGVIELVANNELGGIIVNVVKLNPDKYSWIDNNYENILQIFIKAYDIAKEKGLYLKLPDHLGKKQIDHKISKKSCNDFCENPWKEVYIRYNGDLTVCNMLNPYIYGNLKNYSFESIWNGLNAEMFRNFVNTKFRHYYCRDCYYLI